MSLVVLNVGWVSSVLFWLNSLVCCELQALDVASKSTSYFINPLARGSLEHEVVSSMSSNALALEKLSGVSVNEEELNCINAATTLSSDCDKAEVVFVVEIGGIASHSSKVWSFLNVSLLSPHILFNKMILLQP